MYCKDKIVYTVQEGDTLYRLSRTYHTTVSDLILGNPGTNPYNLQAGMELNICPGDSWVSPREERTDNIREPEPVQKEQSVKNSEEMLRDAMRMALLDMAYWKYIYMVSVDAQEVGRQTEAPDMRSFRARAFQALEERLLEATDEITDIFAEYIPAEAVRRLRDILAEHVALTEEIMRVLKSGDMDNYDALIRKWYANASRIADFLGEQKPHFSGRETVNMLQRDLDLTQEAMEHQFGGEYAQSMEAFGNIKRQALELADHLVRGLSLR